MNLDLFYKERKLERVRSFSSKKKVDRHESKGFTAAFKLRADITNQNKDISGPTKGFVSTKNLEIKERTM